MGVLVSLTKAKIRFSLHIFNSQSDKLAFFYQVLVGLVNTLTTVLALVIIDRVGRKQLVYYGVSGMVVSLLLIGIYFLFGDSWGVSSLTITMLFIAWRKAICDGE